MTPSVTENMIGSPDKTVHFRENNQYRYFLGCAPTRSLGDSSRRIARIFLGCNLQQLLSLTLRHGSRTIVSTKPFHVLHFLFGLSTLHAHQIFVYIYIHVYIWNRYDNKIFVVFPATIITTIIYVYMYVSYVY